MTNVETIDRKPSGGRSMEASTCFRWTVRFVAAARAGNSHAHHELEMRGRAVIKRISIIVRCDTDVKTVVADRPVAFQPAPTATIAKLDARGAMCLGRPRGAYGFIKRDRIESVDRLDCVARELAAGVSL
jgi:hypothetical protein